MAELAYADDKIEVVFELHALCDKGMKLYFDSITGPWRNEVVSE